MRARSGIARPTTSRWGLRAREGGEASTCRTWIDLHGLTYADASAGCLSRLPPGPPFAARLRTALQSPNSVPWTAPSRSWRVSATRLMPILQCLRPSGRSVSASQRHGHGQRQPCAQVQRGPPPAHGLPAWGSVVFTDLPGRLGAPRWTSRADKRGLITSRRSTLPPTAASPTRTTPTQSASARPTYRTWPSTNAARPGSAVQPTARRTAHSLRWVRRTPIPSACKPPLPAGRPV